jgi:hypothetical protein
MSITDSNKNRGWTKMLAKVNSSYTIYYEWLMWAYVDVISDNMDKNKIVCFFDGV